jgi:hypothetical protein
MYDMYPASWRVVVDESERKAHRNARADHDADHRAVQEAMNRRDNGGEPTQ